MDDAIAAEERARALAPEARRRRLAAALEVACLIVLIETIMWAAPFTPRPSLVYGVMATCILSLLFVCHVRDGASAGELGFRLDNLARVLKRLALPLGAFALVMLAVGAALGSLRIGLRFFGMLVTVPLWGLLQQYMLLAFANRRFRVLFGPGLRSVAATAALFGLMHLPNPTLCCACALGGIVWAREYEREPNLFANALTHAAASAVLANSLPKWILKSMVVGYNYFLR